MENKIIGIELTNEKIQYTIVGSKEELQLLQKKCKSKKYIISKLISPILYIVIDEIEMRNIDIEVDNYSEKMQYSLLCNYEEYEKNLYMLLIIDEIIDKHVLKFPEIKLKKTNNIEKIICDDIKKNIPCLNINKNNMLLLELNPIF
jgi:hypothetical protein